MNTFGKIFTLTTFGESHGSAIGGIIDGVPAGVPIDISFIQHQLDRRRPGQSDIVTPRNESDRVTILSGLFNGITTGTPIGFTIPNTAHNSADYGNMANLYRPSHADFTYEAKYGIRDYRGGGRASARETATRIVGGAVASTILKRMGINILAYTSAVGNITTDISPLSVSEDMVEASPTRCPDAQVAPKIYDLISNVRKEGDTVGGIITGVITGVPAGIGEPVFDKLQASLASAMMSINAAHGFEYGMGFDGARLTGSETIDIWEPAKNDPRGIHTTTNNSGGIQGGISNGEPIIFRVAFKPVATLLRPTVTVDRDGNVTTLDAHGRHDPCVVPRAVPIVEAMAAMTILDAILLQRTRRL